MAPIRSPASLRCSICCGRRDLRQDRAEEMAALGCVEPCSTLASAPRRLPWVDKAPCGRLRRSPGRCRCADRPDRRPPGRPWRRSGPRSGRRRYRAARRACAAPSSAGRPSRRPRGCTSSITCSRSAVVSTNMALRPPVSAMKRHDRAVARGKGAVDRPGGVGAAGEGDAGAARMGDQRLADRRAVAGQQVPAGRGAAPRRGYSRTASAAISGVCSAGLASTALPAASAAAIWPVKMASGKFHGLMQAKTPRPCRRSWLVSPTGPCSVSRPGELPLGQARRSSGRSRRPRAPRRRRRTASCRPRATQIAISRSRSASSASAMARSTGARPSPPRRPRRAGRVPRRRRRRRRRPAWRRRPGR